VRKRSYRRAFVGTLFAVALAAALMPARSAAGFSKAKSFRPLSGEPVTVAQLAKAHPIFVIHLPNADATADALRLITLVDSLSASGTAPEWILHLGFDSSPAGRAFLRRFSKDHLARIGRLDPVVTNDQLRIEWLDRDGRLLWRANGIPDDAQWATVIRLTRERLDASQRE